MPADARFDLPERASRLSAMARSAVHPGDRVYVIDDATVDLDSMWCDACSPEHDARSQCDHVAAARIAGQLESDPFSAFGAFPPEAGGRFGARKNAERQRKADMREAAQEWVNQRA